MHLQTFYQPSNKQSETSLCANEGKASAPEAGNVGRSHGCMESILTVCKDLENLRAPREGGASVHALWGREGAQHETACPRWDSLLRAPYC